MTMAALTGINERRNSKPGLLVQKVPDLTNIDTILGKYAYNKILKKSSQEWKAAKEEQILMDLEWDMSLKPLQV